MLPLKLSPDRQIIDAIYGVCYNTKRCGARKLGGLRQVVGMPGFSLFLLRHKEQKIVKLEFVANVMFSILFGILAIAFLAIGIRGLKIRRPFLISLRLPFLIMLIYCISLLVQFLFFSFSEPILVLRWTPLFLCACSLLMLCYTMKQGYMAFGVTYTPFRQGLLATLEKLQFPFEEPSSLRRLQVPLFGRAIQLKTGEAELEASMWMGAIHLKVKQSQHYPLLREIVDATNEHFRTSPVRTNITSFAFDIIVAILLLAVGVTFFSRSF